MAPRLLKTIHLGGIFVLCVSGLSGPRAAENVDAADRGVLQSETDQVSSTQESSQSQIAALIEGLASDSYATRIRCRDRLSRIGLAAFDQLREARSHPDSEVAIVARRLTSGLGVQWSTEDDSPAVVELLSEYGARSVSERTRRIAKLALLPRLESFSALLRLAEFEPEPSLARVASLALMNQDAIASKQSLFAEDDLDQDSNKDQRRRLEANAIQSQLVGRSTVVNRWLLQYADDLHSGNVQVENWHAIFNEHRNGEITDEESKIRV